MTFARLVKTPDPDFEARCDLTGNARRVTRDARGSVIESRLGLPATMRSEKRALSDLDLSLAARRTIVFPR